MDNKEHIIKFRNKLNNFIDKYYKFNFIKGLLLSGIVSLGIVIFLSIFEYVFWTNSGLRLGMLVSGGLSIILIIGYFIFIPVARWLNILKRLTHKDAVNFIKRNSGEIDDTIINIVELDDLNSKDDLVIASIHQKIDKLKAYDFKNALNDKRNFDFLLRLVVVIIFGIVVGLIQPSIYSDGTKRIINYKLNYNKKLGYELILIDSNLYVKKGNDLNITIHSVGKKSPEDLLIVVNGQEFLCKKRGHVFTYEFKHINNGFNFSLKSSAFKSANYKVEVWNPASITEYSIDLNFPDYTRIENISIKNNSNIKVPIGTMATWKFEGNYIDSLYMVSNDTILKASKKEGLFTVDWYLLNETNYIVKTINKNENVIAIGMSNIEIIPDNYPEIEIEEIIDESNELYRYYKGIIKDDYGFKNVVFNMGKRVITIPFNRNLNTQEIYFSYDFSSIKSNSEYYFTVTDNDKVNGYKSVNSKKYKIKIPDKNELAAFENSKNKEILKDIEKAALMSKEIKKDIKELKNLLNTQNLSDWEKNQYIDQLQEKQNELENLIDQLAKNNTDKNKRLNNFQKTNESLIKKQKEIEELLNAVIDDELKDLLEKLEELQKENLNQQELNDLLENAEFKYNDIEKELDKNLELLKKFKIEKNLENQVQNLLDLAKDQEKLANEKFDSTLNNKNLKDIENIESSFNDIENDNSQLEKPIDLENVKEELNTLKENIEKNSNNKSQDKAKENSQKSEKIAEQIENMLKSNMSEQNAEDANDLRQILENLFYFSFNEESMEKAFYNITKNNPNYIGLKQKQQNYQNQYTIIRDSLYAVAKRNSSLGAHINDKSFSIEQRLHVIDEWLIDDKVSKARIELRKLITETNDLILLLSESLKQMDNMGGGGGGKPDNNKKKKPQKGKPSMSDIRSMQQGLKEQLKQMLNKMKGGGQPGAGELGKMLAKQEILQQMLNEMRMNKELGNQAGKLLNEINQLLNDNKRDLINFDLTQRTLERHRLIETRLLEAENAEEEREKEEKRKSKEAENYNLSNPEKLFENSEQIRNFNDILQKETILLKEHYKKLYQDYINNLNSYPNEKRN